MKLLLHFVIEILFKRMFFVRLIEKTLALHTTADEFRWLQNALSVNYEMEQRIQMAFSSVPRHLKKTSIILDRQAENEFLSTMEFSPGNWDLHKLARVYILLNIDSVNEKRYLQTVHALFETADLNELDVLYTSLPLFAYPKNWLLHAEEAVRSNIGLVFDAIAFNNPYPAKYFEERAWNQLVLKTIFTGKDIRQIRGLHERANRALACMISDFANERWAAGRCVSPLVWDLVTPFIDSDLLHTIEQLFKSEDEPDKHAAKLCCMNTDFEPAKALLKKYDDSFITKRI